MDGVDRRRLTGPGAGARAAAVGGQPEERRPRCGVRGVDRRSRRGGRGPGPRRRRVRAAGIVHGPRGRRRQPARRGPRAAVLDAVRQFMVANSAAIMVLVLLILGAKVLGDGLGGLSR